MYLELRKYKMLWTGDDARSQCGKTLAALDKLLSLSEIRGRLELEFVHLFSLLCYYAFALLDE